MAIHLPEATYNSDEDFADVARAAETLRRIFPDYDVEFRRRGLEPKSPAPILKAKIVRRTRGKGNRAKVIRATADKFATVEQIAAETGLETRKVRGVVNAPGLKGRFEKQAAGNGVTAYKFVPANKSDES